MVFCQGMHNRATNTGPDRLRFLVGVPAGLGPMATGACSLQNVRRFLVPAFPESLSLLARTLP